MPKKKKKRRYSDDVRAGALAALAANGGNVKLTASQLGIPETTLRQWNNGGRHPEAAQMSDQKKGPLADELERIAWKLADAIPDKITLTMLQPLVTSLAIVIDKMQLLRNKPTAINRDEFADDDLRDLTDDELTSRLEAARTGVVAPRELPAGEGPPPGGAAGAGTEPPAG